MSRFSRCLALGLLAAGLAATGCGSDDDPATSTNPTASAPDATAPPADATQPGTTAVTPPPAETEPGGATGGGGAAPPDASGEQAVRVPASFVVTTSGRLDPPEITVPPFLAVEVSVRADDGRAHRLELRTPTPHVLDVAAGGRATVRIPGLRAGRYELLLDGREAGAVIAGGEVGP
ncbi:MAG TPA: hypothetical protein VK506_07735 [Conexibacter sp.]|nr:hypothetical protein [Conexibacter sp.]